MAIIQEIPKSWKPQKKLMNLYHDEVILLTAAKPIYVIKGHFFMNLIKTSKNKNYFILKESQISAVVVLTLFVFYQYLLGNKSKRNQKNKTRSGRTGCNPSLPVGQNDQAKNLLASGSLWRSKLATPSLPLMTTCTYYANTQAHCTNRACLKHRPAIRLTRAAHAHPITPQHWLLCHMGLY